LYGRRGSEEAQAGVLRSLMLRGVDVRPFRDRLLDPRPGATWFCSAVPLHATLSTAL